MSNNRVKALTSHSFELYDDLVFLYLMENKIHKLEKGTFTPLSKLEAINLSGNVLSTIPLDLLELPKLRNLYINDNELFRLSSDLMVINSKNKKNKMIKLYGKFHIYIPENSETFESTTSYSSYERM